MSSKQQLFEACHRELTEGNPVVRAVILRTWGSTPREVGADMVMDRRGGLSGTVGGGCGEAEVYELAQELLHTPESTPGAVLHVDLTEDPERGGEAVCGGRFDVLLHRLEPAAHAGLLGEVVQKTSQGQAVEWRTELGDVEPGFWKHSEERRVNLAPRVSLSSDTSAEPSLVSTPEGHVFIEPVGLSRTLVIVGAGHIARPLCAMAALAGYQVVVLDDRAEYARKLYFPDAFRVVSGEYEKHLPALARDELTSVVLVTRGHRHDQECLRLIASRKLEYVGMIGSRRRIEAVFAELVEEGFEKEDLRRVCAPIGLEIGAQTPAEIAVSILAQMIQRRRKPAVTGREAVPRRRRIGSV